MKKYILILWSVLALLSACQNQDWEFPDYDYSTVYFAYQAPLRTIELGDDTLYDNSLDKQYQCLIMATTGGTYSNKKNITIGIVIDTSLCNNLRLTSATKDTFDAVPMPSNYYSLPSDMQIVIPAGKMSGGIKVQLTDAFFADPRAADLYSTKNVLVIPLRITSVINADSVLSGLSLLANPDPRVAGDWVTVPKDYILYGIKYINPWHGTYLRRGKEVVTVNGTTAFDTTVVYHKKYVESDDVVSLYTKSMTEDTILFRGKNKSQFDLVFVPVLKFENDGKCSVTNPAAASYTITGNGEFVKYGDMWGNTKRDVIHLHYTVNDADTTHTFNDTLVLRDRNIKFEAFNTIVD